MATVPLLFFLTGEALLQPEKILADPMEETLPCPPGQPEISPLRCIPPAPPISGRAHTETPRHDLRYRHDIVFTVKITKKNWRKDFRRRVAAKVAKRAYPHPTMEEFAILDTTIRFLGNEEMHLHVRRLHPTLYKIRVSKERLNWLERRLIRAVKQGHLDYRVAAIRYNGGNRSQQMFLKKAIPLPPDSIMDSSVLAKRLYQISQVTGFKRADAIFSAAVYPRPVHFDAAHGYSRGIRFIIHTKDPHWSHSIRRSIVLYVAKLVFDLKNPFAQEIALLVASHSESLFWKPMTISIASHDTYRVQVPVQLLRNIRNALVARSQVGLLAPSGQTAPASSLDEFRNGSILSTQALNTSVSDEKVTPRSQEIMEPVSGPEFENLLLHITPTPLFEGSQVEVDNYGYAPTGAVVPTFTGVINNAGTAGGLLSLNASTSFGGLNSATLSYSLPGSLTTRAGIDLNAMNYVIGRGYSPWGQGPNAAQQAALGIAGDSFGGDLWSQQSLIERQDRSLFIKEMGFWKAFQDTYSPTAQNLRQVPGGTLDLNGFINLRNVVLSFDLSDTAYDLIQGAGSSPSTGFATTTDGVRDYADLTGTFRLNLSKVYAFILTTVDQEAMGGLLDPMLQATLGGMGNVRALPTASLFGNNLDSASLSLSRNTPTRLGDLSESLFFDLGEVSGSGGTYNAMGPGVEVSLNASHLYMKLDVAIPVGPLPVATLGPSIPALTGENISQGEIPIQGWLSIAVKY